MMKNMGMDFIVGYAFNTLERKIIKALKEDENKSDIEKSRIYSADVSIPLQWFGEYDVNRMTQKSKEDIAVWSRSVRDVTDRLKDIFADTAFGRNFKIDIFSHLSDGRYVNIVMDMIRNLKELTMEELEKIVGYPFKIVEKKVKEKPINKYIAMAFAWNTEDEV